jgi:hypothetical protein
MFRNAVFEEPRELAQPCGLAESCELFSLPLALAEKMREHGGQ